jgi:two-component system, cell cycle response regulator CpdR
MTRVSKRRLPIRHASLCAKPGQLRNCKRNRYASGVWLRLHHNLHPAWLRHTGMIRILLAEDDDMMRHYLIRALEQAGYEVDAVDNGAAALPLLQSHEYDLLVSDIVMPEMDGIELAQRCGEISPGTRVIFITGFAAVALKTGGDAPKSRVLSKPFHLRDLVLEVERVFSDEATFASL